MRLQKKLSWNPFAFLALCMAVFYYYIAYNVPYTGDDWDWGLEIGLRHLLTADINSRYIGNFFAVIMTRSKLMQTIIMGSSYFVLPFLMAKIVLKSRNQEKQGCFTILFIAANCLLLSMDSQIWQQTYGWVSGFSNYGISAVLLVIYVYLVQPLFEEKLKVQKASIAKIVMYFLLGLTIQLFIENLAVAMVALSAAVFLISCLRTKKVDFTYLGVLLGNIIGIMIMFSSTIYPALFDTGATLGNGRQLSYDQSGGLMKMVAGCADVFIKEIATLIWEKNVAICCSISVLLIILWIFKSNRMIGKLELALITIDVLSIPYFVIFSYLEYGKYFLLRYGVLDVFELIVNVGFCAVVALQIVLLYRNRKWHMWKLLLIWFSAPLVILPLTAVVIEGARFYLTSNCFLILFSLFLLADCIDGISLKSRQCMISLGLAAVLSFSMFYFFVYREIGICTSQRMTAIAEAKQTGAREIVLPSYPYTVMDYVWWGDPGEEYRNVYFREFFGLGEDVRLIFQLD